ncbi:DMT family transporter [Companilactobacillus ginsenosidimutans]|uniref:Membrane protein n=1 Tax=Companilactobacillus ginsenosidimutans TaxID=1007676 RepID=A0A0H4QLB0_9LACO|nr:DMT family transporter [Companilactobacillus ginsenosidimutans]AKP67881.1 membrane protein [Companilactobacillus ginsenosidimutans]
MIAVLVGLIIGIWQPIQTSINSRLKVSIGSPYLASLFSFGTGTILLALFNFSIYHTMALFPSELFHTQPIWFWIGGAFGVIYLTSNILLFPNLGSVQTAIMPILGQIMMGLLIDNFALFGSMHQPFTWIRAIGALLVVAGVFGAVALNTYLTERKLKKKQHHAKGLMLWRLLGIVAGMFSATQTAINGHVGTVVESSLKSAFLSFFGGTITLFIIVLILHPPLKLEKAAGGNPWWMWTGGIIGAFCVLGNAYIVPIVGTGLAVVIILVGVTTGSLIIDQFGILESKKNPITIIQILSLLVMILGVVMIRLY